MSYRLSLFIAFCYFVITWPNVYSYSSSRSLFSVAWDGADQHSSRLVAVAGNLVSTNRAHRSYEQIRCCQQAGPRQNIRCNLAYWFHLKLHALNIHFLHRFILRRVTSYEHFTLTDFLRLQLHSELRQNGSRDAIAFFVPAKLCYGTVYTFQHSYFVQSSPMILSPF